MAEKPTGCRQTHPGEPEFGMAISLVYVNM